MSMEEKISATKKVGANPNWEALRKYRDQHREQIGQFTTSIQSSDKGSIFGNGFTTEQAATQH